METPNPRSKIAEFFTAHPVMRVRIWIGNLIIWAATFATLFQLFPSFAPWLTAPKRALSYCIYPVRTRILQVAEQSPVSILYKGVPVSGDVTAVQIAIWNAGREPIRAEDILDPVTLRGPTNLILEASILRSARTVCGFHFSTNGTASNGLGIIWRILEKNDGGVVQIVYSGNPDIPFALEGVLVGQRSLVQVTASREHLRKGLSAPFFILMSCLAIVVLILPFILKLVLRRTVIRLDGWWTTLVFGVVFYSITNILRLWHQLPSTPFDF